ncbi:MAG: PIN domain-containing protein [Thermomicrobia bacterium]|nr:PIN domain-containing protein [Thermomicrobia bacterium]
MSGNPPRIYWDANVFLLYLDADPTWLPTLDVLVHAAIQGDIIIYTSILSQTEVAFTAIEKTNGALSASEEARIDGLWKTRGIRVVEYNNFIALKARDIRRASMGHGLTGRRTPDIIHMATAVFVNADEMHSTEPKLHKFSPLLPFAVRDPHTGMIPSPGSGTAIGRIPGVP